MPTIQPQETLLGLGSLTQDPLIILLVINFFFTSNSYSQSLQAITLANGSQTMATSAGQASLLPSLTLNLVLYLPGCPFNLIYISHLSRSLNSSVTFLNNSVVIQDCSKGQKLVLDTNHKDFTTLIFRDHHSLSYFRLS